MLLLDLDEKGHVQMFKEKYPQNWTRALHKLREKVRLYSSKAGPDLIFVYIEEKCDFKNGKKGKRKVKVPPHTHPRPEKGKVNLSLLCDLLWFKLLESNSAHADFIQICLT